jgi:hypothetical protein
MAAKKKVSLPVTYTATPNLYFELMPEMSESEMKVMAFAYRRIIGWHHPLDVPEPIGRSEFSEGTGLSLSSVDRGIDEALERGWLKKVAGVGTRGAAGYLLVFDNQPQEPQDSDPIQIDPTQIDPPQIEEGSLLNLGRDHHLNSVGSEGALNKGNKRNKDSHRQNDGGATTRNHTDFSRLSGYSGVGDGASTKKTKDPEGGEDVVDMSDYTALELWIVEQTKATRKGLTPAQRRELNRKRPLTQGNQIVEEPCANWLWDNEPLFQTWCAGRYNFYKDKIAGRVSVSNLVRWVTDYGLDYHGWMAFKAKNGVTRSSRPLRGDEGGVATVVSEGPDLFELNSRF